MSLCPRRLEVKAIRVPSGDHTEFRSSAGSKVRRVLVPRSRSNIQMSRVFVCGSRMPTDSLLSSGERVGFEYSAVSPTTPSLLPLRSNHCSEDWKDWVLRCHTSTPPGESEQVAAGKALFCSLSLCAAHRQRSS